MNTAMYSVAIRGTDTGYRCSIARSEDGLPTTYYAGTGTTPRQAIEAARRNLRKALGL